MSVICGDDHHYGFLRVSVGGIQCLYFIRYLAFAQNKGMLRAYVSVDIVLETATINVYVKLNTSMSRTQEALIAVHYIMCIRFDGERSAECPS